LKRKFILVLFFVNIVFAAFAQKEFFPDTSFNSNEPKPLTTTTVTCGTLTLVISETDPKCNGAADGTASVVVSGGTAPYTYLWSPSGATTMTATGLVGNTYVIEVWDHVPVTPNYCSGSIALVNPPSLIVNITPPAPVSSCWGMCDGSATASPTGGTAPYTYSWNTVPVQTTALATGLCALTYSVTVVDGNGCIKVRSVVIGQPALLVANGSSTSIACFGACNGTASVAPTGGNPPYTYSWAPGGATTSSISALCPNTYTCTVKDAKICVATYVANITQPPSPLTVTVTSTNLLCNSVCIGTATANAAGGTPGYTYSWVPGGYSTSAITGLCAGNYTLTLTDANGCMQTATVAITQPTAVNVTPTAININCFGQCTGVVNANASGGILPYTYAWSPGGCTTSSCTGLCAGNYSLTVTDANGCQKLGTVTITEPTQLAVVTSHTNVTCSGFCNGSITATATGGTPPYMYAWSPGGCTTSACAGLCSGAHSYTVTDTKGCTATGSDTITSPLILLPNATSTGASCAGVCDGTVSSAATGGTAPYVYLWTPGGYTTSAVSGLCAGTYTIKVTDSHLCISTSTISVTQPNVFTASISSATPNPLNCNGDCNGTAAVTPNGGTPTYTYLWSTGSTDPSVTGLCAGVYNVNITDSHGCLTSTSVTFLQPTTLTVTIVSSNPTCSGGCNGSISAIAGGGTPGYTFSWLPGGQTTSTISSQCVGNYTLTAADSKGCPNTQTVTLTTAFPLAANASVVKNISCSGVCDGSVTANPTGGSFPFTYLWAPSGQTIQTVTGLCAGTFSVTVTDANGCTNIDIVTITQPNVLSSSISSTTSSCSLCTGTASVATSGGTFPYTYLWTPSGQTTSAAVGLCIGTYTVDVTDANGCKNFITAVIPPVVSLTITVSGTSVNCAGSCDGVASATPFGGSAPYNYLWSPGGQTTQSATGFCAGSYTVNVSDVNGCISANTLSFSNPPVLSVAMSSVSASCGVCNGTATATPSGGTGAYTYTWSGFPVQTTATATGLCAGTYSITLADANNCATTNTVVVGNILSISDNPSITLANCGLSDGSICLAPSGGTPPYTYVWSPGGATTACITGVPSGIYTVTITDAIACAGTFPIGVGNAAGPTVNVTSSVNPSCNGYCNGSISVSASGATPPYTFLWNPGAQTTNSITGLCAGTYIVRVKDAVPCTTFLTVVLTDPAPIVPHPSITNVSCNGGNNGSICLAPTGGTGPYTFSWNNGQTTACATGLTAGTYTVAFSDASGCSDTIFIPVNAPPLLNVTLSSTDVTCNGSANGTATATVTGGTTLYIYAWSTGSPMPSIVGLSPGNYSLTVTDSKGCIGTASIAITQPAALTTTISSTNVSCNSLCDATATLATAGGTLPYSYFWIPGGQTTLSVTGLCVGNYNGTITDAHGCSSTKSVTITQPSVLSVTVSPTNASCFGGCNGTASANANGGTSPYTYLWNPGGQTTSSATGLCTGPYTLSVSDANGCVVNDLFPISSPTQLQANITNNPPLCFGGCNGTATSSPIGGTGSYTFLWSNGQTTATATGLCAGTYTLTLFDANGCSISQAANIAAPAPITLSSGVAGATCLVCNGSISVIAFGGTPAYAYAWLPAGQTTANITGLCAGLYTVTITDVNGCKGVDTIPVSNTSGPSLVTTSTNISCFGFCNGTGTVAATGDGPPWAYVWSTTPTQTTAAIIGLCPAQYFITVTDTNGCVTINSINITQPGPLASNPTITNATCFGLCNGGITLTPSGGTLPYTFNWFPGGQTTVSISSQCARNYTVNITDAKGCALTTTMTIGQNTILTSTVTSTNDSCNALCDGTAAINIFGGTLPYTYAWSGGQTTAAATGLCAGTNTITVTDAIGCIHIDSAIITQPAVLASNIVAINPLCNGDCNGSVSTAPTGGTAPYTYLWIPGGATTTSITGLCAGNFTLTLSDAHHCSTTNTIVLTSPALISSTDVETKSSCANTHDGSITITPAGGTIPYTYNWQPGNMTTQNATGLVAGIYSVTITDVNGCSFTDSMTVGATVLVIAKAGNDTSYCVGGTATLCNGSFNATSFGWYQIQAPTWASLGNTNCLSVSPPVGNTSYALIAMNGICTDTDTVVVTVNNYPVVFAGNDTSACLGDSVKLCASGANVYQWYKLPAWTPVAAGTCITVAPALGVTSYVVIGKNGVCADTDTVAVTVLAMPIAIAGNDTAFCAGNSALLCSHSIATSVAWYQLPSWTLIDTTNCINPTPLINTSYALIASNGGCKDTDTVAVTLFPVPAVNAGNDVTILSGGTASLNGSGSGIFNWTPATGLSCTTCANPSANPTVTITYTLIATDTAHGCTSFDTVRVFVVPIIVPNDGISPNGDGLNDVWVIPFIELFPECVVEVYNRWGELIFSETGYKNSTAWDGKYKGKDLPVGTYYYTINLHSIPSQDPVTGPITIMR